MTQTSAMAAALTLPISIIGAAGCIIAGLSNPALPHYSVGFVYLPAVIGITLGSLIGVPIGTKLAYKIPDRYLAKSYLIVLILVLFLVVV